MGLLQAGNVRYYHPLDDTTEATKSFAWTGPGGSADFAAGQVGNAARTAGVLSQARLTYTPASAYGDLSGANHFACAFWTSGLFAANSNNHSVDVGFGNVDGINGLRNGFKLRNTGSVTMFGTWTGLSSGKGVTSPPTDADWHFVVLDLDLETNWRLRTSFDGAPFTDEGLFGSGLVPDSDGRAFIQAVRASGAPEVRVDEVALWSGHNLFTTQELANLYDLGNTFGEGLDQYEENFGAPLCWQATATMPDGSAWRDSGSGPCPAVVRVPRGADDIVVTDDGHRVNPRIIEG